NICIAVNGFYWVFVLAAEQAVTILAGRALGADDVQGARAAVRKVAMILSVPITCFCIVCLAATDAITGIFHAPGADVDMAALTSTVRWFIAAFIVRDILEAGCHLLSGALTAALDTGAILAAAVNADIYENFTDVDSVFAANPNIVDDPMPIPMFSYEEMRELSYAGFNVLHEEALAPVYHKGITVNIKNTNNPDTPGTLIVPTNALTKEHKQFKVVGIAADKGFMTLHVEKYMMNREIGFGRRLLQILEDEGISYEHTPSGIDSISVIIREKYYNEDVFDKIIKSIYQDLLVDNVALEFGQAIVMVVGNGMTHSIGTLATATRALADANININMINQGSSEVSIMFGIDEDDASKSVKALYKAFFG
ncbi:MAG: ACT domain-containing protein, partial [Bacteroidales bacterium]|nr:ACT domain-containing protein [Bacteroidales bacterium]